MFCSRLLRIFIALTALIQFSLCHSTDRNPITDLHVLHEPVIGTPSRRVHAFSHFDLFFTLDDQKLRLSLEPNHDLLHDTLHVTRLDSTGRISEIEPIERTDFKVFKGHAFVQHPGSDMWTQAGWARITFHRDGKNPIFEGVFRVDGDHHHIHSLKDYRRTKLFEDPDVPNGNLDAGEIMVVWKDSSIIPNVISSELKRAIKTDSCVSESLSVNHKFNPLKARDDAGEMNYSELQGFSPSALFGRQIDGSQTGDNGAGVNLQNSIGSTAGCFSSRRVALIGIATDCTYQQDFDTEADMRANVIKQINSASAVYESSFNISLGIQNLTVTGRECPTTANPSAQWNVACDSSTDITKRLNLFSSWRGLSNDSNAFWTLLSKCNTGSAVGLAWLGQACVSGALSNSGSNETVSSTNVVVRTSTEWQVIAHEVGHTFGAVHDCTADTCALNYQDTSQCCPLSTSTCNADGKYIMNPSTGSGITAFSPCSIGNICSAIGRASVRTDCLTDNKNVATITGAQCGNGIVETGEDCDCGGTSGCGDNKCCDPTTCKFTTNSKCDPSNEDCCTSECQLASKGTVCRASTGQCDPQEVCNGTVASCPANLYTPDGTSCGKHLQCSSGQCTSRDQQCKAATGSSTSANSTDTYACGDSSSCQLQCVSPRYRTTVCVQSSQTFLDGTSCGTGGLCKNGVCTGQSIGKELGGFFQRYKHIIIPVASAVGGLLVLMLLCCLYTSIKRRSRMARNRRIRTANKQAVQMPPPPAAMRHGGGPYGGDMPPPYASSAPRYA